MPSGCFVSANDSECLRHRFQIVSQRPRSSGPQRRLSHHTMTLKENHSCRRQGCLNAREWNKKFRVLSGTVNGEDLDKRWDGIQIWTVDVRMYECNVMIV
jgi:hypothetical protein